MGELAHLPTEIVKCQGKILILPADNLKEKTNMARPKFNI